MGIMCRRQTPDFVDREGAIPLHFGIPGEPGGGVAGANTPADCEVEHLAKHFAGLGIARTGAGLRLFRPRMPLAISLSSLSTSSC